MCDKTGKIDGPEDMELVLDPTGASPSLSALQVALPSNGLNSAKDSWILNCKTLLDRSITCNIRMAVRVRW